MLPLLAYTGNMSARAARQLRCSLHIPLLHLPHPAVPVLLLAAAQEVPHAEARQRHKQQHQGGERGEGHPAGLRGSRQQADSEQAARCGARERWRSRNAASPAQPLPHPAAVPNRWGACSVTAVSGPGRSSPARDRDGAQAALLLVHQRAAQPRFLHDLQGAEAAMGGQRRVKVHVCAGQ